MEEKDKIILENIYRPSEGEINVIADVYQKYYKWRNFNTSNYDQFGGTSLVNYIKTARQKFNGVVPIDPTIARKKYFSQEFRNAAEQIVTYVANLAQNPSFYGEEGLDINISILLNSLLKAYRKGVYYKILDALHFLQTIIDGTGIVYISWNPKKRKIKDIKQYNPETGEIDFEDKEKEENEIEEIWVDPLDVFIPKVWEIDIQKQGELIWRKIMTWSDFKRYYSSYPLSSYVYPGERLSDKSIFSSFLDKGLYTSDKIEIIQYYNSEEDEFVILANGVFLNPVGRRQRSSRKSPLPWNHKQLPFAKTIYRPTSPPLFWGASLINLVKDEVDAFNELIEMSLDRVYRAINPPIITTDHNVPNNIKLESGKIYISRGNWKEIQMTPLEPNVWNLYSFLQNQISKTSTPLLLPTTPTRQPKSAMENLIRQQRELQSYQSQKLFFQDLLEQKIWLFIKNILQFLTSEKIRRATGSTFEKVIFVDNVQTPAGMSLVQLRIKDGVSEPEKLKAESIIKSLVMKKRVEIVEVSYSVLNDLKFDVGIKFDLENTPELKKAVFIDFIKTIYSLFGQQIDPLKVLIRLFEVYNENPADYLPDSFIVNVLGKAGAKSSVPMLPQVKTPTNENIIQTQRGTQGVLGTGVAPLKDLLANEGI